MNGLIDKNDMLFDLEEIDIPKPKVHVVLVISVALFVYRVISKLADYVVCAQRTVTLPTRTTQLQGHVSTSMRE